MCPYCARDLSFFFQFPRRLHGCTPLTCRGCRARCAWRAERCAAFKNLKVLPDNISRDDLRKLMRQFTGDLGVECEFCHAAADPVTRREDGASDANPTKDTARYMIQMTDDLNTRYLEQMPDRRYADPITCGTCHRGEKHPSVFVAPPRQQGNRPAPAPSANTPPAAIPVAAAPPAK